jgi:hypothetical protein
VSWGYGSGSPILGLAALGVCIFVMVLGSMPLPQLMAPRLMLGVIAGAVTGTLYRLAVQPVIATPAGLVLTILPFLLVGGILRAHPRSGPAGVDANMCFLLASQAGMPASHDPAGIIQGSLALALSASLMAGLFILLPRRVFRQAADAAQRIRRDLQRILESRGLPDSAAWQARSSRQILRLALHLGRASNLGQRWPRGLLAVINLGQAMIDQQRLGLPEDIQDLLTAVMQKRLPPETGAANLLAWAAEEADPSGRRLLERLGRSLAQSADLLTFGL